MLNKLEMMNKCIGYENREREREWCEWIDDHYCGLPGKYDGGADDDGGPLRDLRSSM